jgi:hypothetical protein
MLVQGCLEDLTRGRNYWLHYPTPNYTKLKGKKLLFGTKAYPKYLRFLYLQTA